MPRHSVGVVIGRSGEMIKKIQNDAGVRIQFKQGQAESCPPKITLRVCWRQLGTMVSMLSLFVVPCYF